MSMDVAKVNPFKLVSKSCILRIRNVTLCSFEFKTLKSDTTLTVPFYFGMMKIEIDTPRLLGVLKLLSHTGIVFPFLVCPCVSLELRMVLVEKVLHLP
jgi:hypothetical protein